MLKITIVKIYQQVRSAQLNAQILATVHDEIVMRARDEHVELLKQIITTSCECAFKELYGDLVPLGPVDVNVADYWKKG